MQYAPLTSGGLEKADSMDAKLTILFMLIGAVIGLSHLSEIKLDRVRRQLVNLRWREFVPLRRRSVAAQTLDKAAASAAHNSVRLKVSPPRSTASAATVGRPLSSLSVKPGKCAGAPSPAFVARTSTRIDCASGRG